MSVNPPPDPAEQALRRQLKLLSNAELAQLTHEHNRRLEVAKQLFEGFEPSTPPTTDDVEKWHMLRRTTEEAILYLKVLYEEVTRRVPGR